MGLLKVVNWEAKATYVLLSAWSFQEPRSQLTAPSCAPCFSTAFSFLAGGPQSHPSSRLRIWALSDPSPRALPFQPAATQLAPINFLPSSSTHIWPPAARPSPAGLWGLSETLAVLFLSPPTSPGPHRVSRFEKASRSLEQRSEVRPKRMREAFEPTNVWWGKEEDRFSQVPESHRPKTFWLPDGNWGRAPPIPQLPRTQK